MMMECKGLTKWFGAKKAVEDLTLNLDKEDIRTARREREREDDMDEDGSRPYEAEQRRDPV